MKQWIRNIRKKIYIKLRWGEVRSEIKETIEGFVCEEDFYDEEGNLIGQWCYGEWSPNLPFQGWD